MSERRQFVPFRRTTRKAAAFLAAAALAAGTARADTFVHPSTHARAYEPGEVVRFEVRTDPAATAVAGTFRKAGLSFAPLSRNADETIWVAWGVIPLDAEAGTASYTVKTSGLEGAGLSMSADLTILAKSFPEQRLTVESKFVNPPKTATARIEREQKTLAAIYKRRTALTPPAEPFVRPVPGEPTSEFGTRRFFNDEPRSPHPGLDLRAATGTPVLAAGPGTVALATDLYYSGGTVIVDHGGGLFTIYAHLSKIEAKVGTKIAAGARVGLSGATGRVTGPHLHWGARVGDAIFDPRGLLDPKLFAGG